ncbi:MULTISPECIES: GrlR family regulatory protein [Brevundimonas]|uniref:GrlR family regulatory protein n=1 Tax=Brevundimonas TaxID=41275 RepID=UPI003207ACB3
MQRGLYQAAFKTPIGSGYGVITAANGKLSGGDGRSYYLGDYELIGSFLVVDLKVSRHRPLPLVRSVLGARNATVQVSGEFDGESAELTGFAISSRVEPISVSVRRLSQDTEREPEVYDKDS